MKRIVLAVCMSFMLGGCASMQTRLDRLDIKNRQGQPVKVEEVAVSLLGVAVGYAAAYHYGEWWGALGWTAICMRW